MQRILVFGRVWTIFFSFLDLWGNPENTVCKLSLGWGRGALNLRTSSSPKSSTTSSGWTPAGREKRHTNELLNELLGPVMVSRLPSTTTTFFSKVITRSSGWNLATLMDHWIRNAFEDSWLLDLCHYSVPYRVVFLVACHFTDFICWEMCFSK